MTTATGAAEQPKPKRRWLRYSLRSFLLFTVLLSIFLAWIGNTLIRVHQQRIAVTKIKSLGGDFYYDYQIVGKTIQANPTPGPKILRVLMGDDAFAYVEAVFLCDPVKTADKDLAILTQLPHLKDVALWGARVTDDGMDHLANITALRGLGLSNTKVTAAGLARLRSANALVTLSLYGATVDDEMLKSLIQLPSLQHLQLVRTNVTSAGLVHVAGLTNLRQLDILEGPRIGDGGMQHLAKLTNLEGLQLLNTAVGDDGLGHLGTLHNLRFLNLDRTSVSDLGMHHLVVLPHLIHVRLENTNVGDAGLQTLTQINSLERLTIGGAKITDAGVIHIARMPSLQSLHVYPSKVSDAGILRLKSLHTLRDLWIGPHVTKAAAQQLRRAIPECRIYFYCSKSVVARRPVVPRG